MATGWRSPVSRAAAEYIEGGNLVDMIKENLVAERIAIEEHANDMHDLLVRHEGRPMLEK